MAQGYPRGSAASRGYDARWRKARLSFLALHPWCELKGNGCGMLASLVDHKTPHRGDMALFWDETNWQSLCEHCHNVHKQRAENATLHGERDHRGRLIRG
jgi:5-methylcytosine-specific restriction endonuclease McrA